MESSQAAARGAAAAAAAAVLARAAEGDLSAHERAVLTVTAQQPG